MNEEPTTTYSYCLDHDGGDWVGADPNFKEVEPNKINQALTLLDQIITEEQINDEKFKKEKANSSNIKEWEQSIGESWTLFHLKRLKDLLK